MTAAPGPPTGWQSAIVTAIGRGVPGALTIRLRPMRPIEAAQGQRVLVRLTAEDGYRTSRSYPVTASAPGRGDVEIAVELRAGGEVSTHLSEELRIGDKLEVRGPIGSPSA
jgi:ferredoxin-NADP reductase